MSEQQDPNQQPLPTEAPRSVSEFAERMVVDGLTPEQAAVSEKSVAERQDWVTENGAQVADVPLAQNPNVTQTWSYSHKHYHTPLHLGKDGVAIPDRRDSEETGKFIDAHFVADPDDRSVNFAMAYDTGRKVSSTVQQMGNAAIDRPGSQWGQFLQSQSGKISFIVPRPGDSGMSMATGKRALHRARSMMGLGGELAIPLLRSGFWVTIKTPLESDLIELNRRLANEKIEFGRITHGLAFSNQESFMLGWLVDFAIRHIVDCTLKNQEDIKSRIDVLDYHTLLWGLVKSIYPRGYNYTRAITTKKENVYARQLITALIDVTKIFWIDNAFFTDSQKAFMAHRQSGSATDKSVEDYRKSLRLSEGREVEIMKDISVLLKVPNVQQQVDSAHLWINQINATIDSTFTTSPPETDERNHYIAIHSRTSQTRNYASWVNEVRVTEHLDDGQGGTNTVTSTITEVEDINDFLTDLSTKEAESKIFIDAIKAFINDCTCSIVAVPETEGEDEKTLRTFPQLIPINVASTFFILLVQQASRIVGRKRLV